MLIVLKYKKYLLLSFLDFSFFFFLILRYSCNILELIKK